MVGLHRLSAPMYRVWIATYTEWRPARWNELPPRAVALEAVDDAVYSGDEAAAYVQGFNAAMLGGDQPIWAVAIPVTIRYEGDVQPGMSIEARAIAFPPRAGDQQSNDNLL